MSLISNHPRIEMRPLASLKVNPANPRMHTEQQIEQIAASIDRWGFINPLVIGEDGLIVAGAGRYHAARKRGLDEVPTLAVAFVTEADRRAFAIADNRLAEKAGWDESLLAREFEFLLDAEFESVELTGFDTAEIDTLLFDDESEANTEDPVELPEQDATPISRRGDLWTCGDHRLLCGDALDPTSYDILLQGERARLVVTDPPYNLKVSNITGSGQIQHREFAQASGEMTKAEFVAFLRAAFRQIVNHSVNGAIAFVFQDWRHIRDAIDASEGVFSELKNVVVWAKTNAGQGAFYRSAHEMILVFKVGIGRHINNFRMGETGRYRTNLWRYAGQNTFRKGRMEELRSHPTVKPLPMICDAIRDCSNRGDLVLDPFVGSGTTLVAAARTRRRGVAIEIDPIYCDVALERLTKETGASPCLGDGRGFDEVRTARLTEDD